MKKILLAAAVAALPVTARAQSLQYPGFYIGAEGGLNWLLNTTSNSTINVFTPIGPVTTSGTTNISFNTGWAAGGSIGNQEWRVVGPAEATVLSGSCHASRLLRTT